MIYKVKKTVTYIAVLLAVTMIVAGGESSVQSARKTLQICADVIIPSLFPFFVCSGLLIYSGFCDVLSSAVRYIMKPVFNISGAGAGPFIIGLLSGYPLGAVTACSLYEKNYLSKTETERLLAFCNNSGPLFIFGSVGIALYSSPQLGAMLYISHILACITVGIIFRFYKASEYNGCGADVSTTVMSIGEIFSTVIVNSVNSILIICGSVMFFGTLTMLLFNILPINGWISGVLMGMCEFVTGTTALSVTDLELWKKLVLSSFIIGFAGLSVHIQVMSVTAKYGLSLKPYIIGKVLHGIIAALYMWGITVLYNPAKAVFAMNCLDINGGFAVGSAFVTIASLSVVSGGIIYGIVRLFIKTGNKSVQH